LPTRLKRFFRAAKNETRGTVAVKELNESKRYPDHDLDQGKRQAYEVETAGEHTTIVGIPRQPRANGTKYGCGVPGAGRARFT